VHDHAGRATHDWSRRPGDHRSGARRRFAARAAVLALVLFVSGAALTASPGAAHTIGLGTLACGVGIGVAAAVSFAGDGWFSRK
jgi:hypothetical protein